MELDADAPLLPVLAPAPRAWRAPGLQHSTPTPSANAPSWPAGPSGGPHPARPERRGRVTARTCKVPGCTVVLQEPAVAALARSDGAGLDTCRYSWRLRVCDAHRRAALVPWPGQGAKRWCQVRVPLTSGSHCPQSKQPSDLTDAPHSTRSALQKCARFEPVTAFRVRPPPLLCCAPSAEQSLPRLFGSSPLQPPPQESNRTCERALTAQYARARARRGAGDGGRQGEAAQLGGGATPWASDLSPSLSPGHTTDTLGPSLPAAALRCDMAPAGRPAPPSPPREGAMLPGAAQADPLAPFFEYLNRSDGDGTPLPEDNSAENISCLALMAQALLDDTSGAAASVQAVAKDVHMDLKLHSAAPQQLDGHLGRLLSDWLGWTEEDRVALGMADGPTFLQAAAHTAAEAAAHAAATCAPLETQAMWQALVASIEATPEPGCVRLSIRATVPAAGPTAAKAPDARSLMQHLLSACGQGSVLRVGRVDLAITGGRTATAVDGVLQAPQQDSGAAYIACPPLPELETFAVCGADPSAIRSGSDAPFDSTTAHQWRLRVRLHGQQVVSLMTSHAAVLASGARVDVQLPALPAQEGLLLCDAVPKGSGAAEAAWHGAHPRHVVLTQCPRLAAEIQAWVRTMLDAAPPPTVTAPAQWRAHRRSRLDACLRVIGSALRAGCPPQVASTAAAVAAEQGMCRLLLRLLSDPAVVDACIASASQPGGLTLLHAAARGGRPLCCEAVLALGLPGLGTWESAPGGCQGQGGATPWLLLLDAEARIYGDEPGLEGGAEPPEGADSGLGGAEAITSANPQANERQLRSVYDRDMALASYQSMRWPILGMALMAVRFVHLCMVVGIATAQSRVDALAATGTRRLTSWQDVLVVYFGVWRISPVWTNAAVVLTAAWLRFTAAGEAAFRRAPHAWGAALLFTESHVTSAVMEVQSRRVYGLTQATRLLWPPGSERIELVVAFGLMSLFRLPLRMQLCLVWLRVAQLQAAYLVPSAPRGSFVMSSVLRPVALYALVSAVLVALDARNYRAWVANRRRAAARLAKKEE